MDRLFHREYLQGFGSEGAKTCSCGRDHTLKTEQVLFGWDVLPSLSNLISERYGSGCRLWILSDENTEEAAGAGIKENLGRLSVEETVLPGLPKPEPTIEEVSRLSGIVEGLAPDLLVSVGGGTISDIVKKISADCGIDNWCVVTSPSVDAFTSGRSAIWFKGYHRSVPAAVSKLVFCDLSILEKTPEVLFLAGLGDLLGKFLAYLDWHLSNLMTGEHICEEASTLGLESARRALDAAERLSENRRSATEYLTDAVLTSGLLMQSMGSSRPAAASEHTIAHHWEMIRAVADERYDLHGILVGLASRMVLSVYRELFRILKDGFRPDLKARLEEFEREPAWEKTLGDEVLPYRFKMVQEMGEKGVLDAAGLEERLERFDHHREKIERLGSKRLGELQRAVKTLEGCGFPYSFSELKVTADRAYQPFPYERYLRNRYTCFDLMYELGLESGLLAKLRDLLLSMESVE
jgi:glycerol-1-phosphate dehydrogenase [NAD(P)+]